MAPGELCALLHGLVCSQSQVHQAADDGFWIFYVSLLIGFSPYFNYRKMLLHSPTVAEDSSAVSFRCVYFPSRALQGRH